VSWISGRTDEIATVFGIASLLAGMRYLDLVSKARNGKVSLRAKPAIGSVALFACALFAKEMGAVVPLIVAIYGALYTFGPRLRRAPAAWLLFAGYAAVLAAYLLLRTQVIGSAAAGGLQPAPEIAKALLTLPKALALYWGKLVLPLSLDAYLVVPYEDHPFSWLGMAGLGLMAGAGAFVLRFRKSEPAACFMVLAYFASFLPLTNIVRVTSPLDMGFTMAERFLYLPSVFFFGFVAWGIERALGAGASSSASATVRGRTAMPPIAVAVGLLVVAFAVQANLRGLDYASNLTFFEKTYTQHPKSELVVMSYGMHLRRAGELDAAIELLEMAYQLNAESGMFSRVGFYSNLAAAYAAKGRFDEAVSLLEDAAAHRTNLSSVYQNLGGVYWLRHDYESAIHYLSLSLDLNPRQGKPRALRVDCLVKMGEFSRALHDLEILRETSGADPEFHVNLGIVYRGLGRLPEAIDAFRIARDLGDRDVKTLMLLGTSLAQMGDFDAAEPYLREAHALEPLALEPAGALARALQRKGLEEQAREIFRELVDRHPRSATSHLMMAQFCVETSELREAAQWLDKARALDPANPHARTLEAHLARAAGK
jgi:tetratricopeptide (TPR) repeat protein